MLSKEDPDVCFGNWGAPGKFAGFAADIVEFIRLKLMPGLTTIMFVQVVEPGQPVYNAMFRKACHISFEHSRCGYLYPLHPRGVSGSA